jgi:gliding motility-associated-like protein
MSYKKYILFFLMLATSTTLLAQLCNGSLGDPIVNITFGSGSNPGAALPAASTNYLYLTTDCPNDGQYTVRNNTNNCYNTWHSLTTDHTGTANGYFMLVNASFLPSAFYVDTVKGLCANTTYELAAWILNIQKPNTCGGNPIQPNLTFRIENTDGSLLKEFNSGNIPSTTSPAWKQYGSFFTTPPSITSVVIRIVNNAAGGCGNDLVLDDITFRPCGPTLTPTADGTANGNLQVCVDNVFAGNFSCIVSAGYTDPFYQWQKSTDNSATWINIPGANSTNYSTLLSSPQPDSEWYRMSVAERVNASIAACKIYSTPIKVTFNARPTITITNNNPVCEGTPVQLTATGGAQYSWTGPNGFTSQAALVTIANAQLQQAGKYILSATNASGCSAIDSSFVQVVAKPVARVAFADTGICSGTAVQLGVSGGSSYVWTPAATLSAANIANPIARPADTTMYKVVVTNTAGCVDTAWVNVNVIPSPTANAGTDKTTVEGIPVQLSASATGDQITIEWTPAIYASDPNILQPFVSPPTDTSFQLTVRSANGCGVARDTVKVVVYEKVLIPNVFSPNGDGINDQWVLTGLDAYKEHEVSIYNRYGQLVLQTTRFKSWDGTYKGTRLAVGTYYYVIKIKEINSSLNGSVLILQ